MKIRPNCHVLHLARFSFAKDPILLLFLPNPNQLMKMEILILMMMIRTLYYYKYLFLSPKNDDPPSPFVETYLYNCAKLNSAEKNDLKSLTCRTTAN
jgi:hypothetical protein